jgi:hypothetical protein
MSKAKTAIAFGRAKLNLGRTLVRTVLAYYLRYLM